MTGLRRSTMRRRVPTFLLHGDVLTNVELLQRPDIVIKNGARVR
jgi:hypothetical protein